MVSKALSFNVLLHAECFWNVGGISLGHGSAGVGTNLSTFVPQGFFFFLPHIKSGLCMCVCMYVKMMTRDRKCPENACIFKKVRVCLL